jgi:hypothetical protein
MWPFAFMSVAKSLKSVVLSMFGRGLYPN